MHHPFVPLVFLLWAPLAYFAYRLGLARHPVVRGVLIGCGVAVLAVAVGSGGVDFLYLKRMKLFLAGATAFVVWLRHARAAGLSDRRRYRAALWILALCAWTVHLNFFSFHGARTFMHIHDVAHYYLGSKYFADSVTARCI